MSKYFIGQSHSVVNRYMLSLKGLGKIKSGIGWYLNYLGVDRNPCEFYLMFLSREIDKKNCVKFIPKSV